MVHVQNMEKKYRLHHHKTNESNTKKLKKADDSFVPGHLQKIKLLQTGLLRMHKD